MDDSKRSEHKPSSGDELIKEARAGRAILTHYKIDDLYNTELNNPFDWYSFPNEIMNAVQRTKKWIDSRL